MRKTIKKLMVCALAVMMLVLVSNTGQANAAAKNNFISDFSVSKKVIYKGNGVSISVNSAKKDSSGLKVEFYVKNSSKKDYGIAAHEFAINNLMAGGSTYGSNVDVPAGKKAKFSVAVKKEWFASNGIKAFKKFDVLFWGYGDSMKEWESEKVSFSTNKDNGSGCYRPKNRIYSDDNMGISYISKKGNTYKLCIENKTDRERRWSVENCSVDGWSYDLGSCKLDLYSNPILNGCYAVFDLVIDDSFKKENGIKSVKTVEFNAAFEGMFDADNNHIEEVKSEKVVLE